MNNIEVFNFKDGMVYLPNGQSVWHDELDTSAFPEGVSVEFGAGGLSVIFENTKETLFHDIRYCTSMPDDLKIRYFSLLLARFPRIESTNLQY